MYTVRWTTSLTMKPSSQAIQENLTAIHTACSAFIASKNDERIKGALVHIIRITSEVKYIKGDICKRTLHNTAHKNSTTDNKTI